MFSLREMGVYYAVIILVTVLSIATIYLDRPNYLSMINFTNVLYKSSLAGALLLYSLTNGFNILNLGANYQGLIEGLVVVTAAAIYTIGNKKA